MIISNSLGLYITPSYSIILMYDRIITDTFLLVPTLPPVLRLNGLYTLFVV